MTLTNAAAALLILVLLYLYLILPRFSHRKQGKVYDGVLFAHRGLFSAKENIPENSLPAFSRAVKSGYGIELDVQLTKDNQVVVFHDSTLSRMCGIDVHVREKTYAQLKDLSLLNTEEKIPLFSQVLNVIDGSVPLLIEIKLPCFSTYTCQLVNDILKNYKGTYCIQSFNALALLWYRIHRPDVFRGQLSSNLLSPVAEGGIILSFLIKYLMANFLGRPDFISYKYKDDKNISFQMHKRLFGTPVMAWTIRSQKAFESCITRYNAIIFDSFIPTLPKNG